jgi:hypothetical protein
MADTNEEPRGTAWLLAMVRAVREAEQSAPDPRGFVVALPDALAGVEPNAFVWTGTVDRDDDGPAGERVRVRGASGSVTTPSTVTLGTDASPGPTAAVAADGEAVALADATANPEYRALRDRWEVPAGAASVSVPFTPGSPATGAAGGDADPPGERGVLHLYTDLDGTREAVREAAEAFGLAVTDSFRSVAADADRARDRRRLEAVRSTLSHDFGNPINLAAGRLELAADDCESPHHDHVQRALERIESLATDCTSFVEAGRPVQRRERQSVAAAARRCWEGLATGGSSLETEAVTVAAEPARLGRLLTVLLENALVHTDGPVTVAVEALAEGRGFAVRDTGDGILPDERDLVFDRGYTTAPDRDGQGLAIAREMADAHGWQLDLAGADEGTRVEILTDRW